jgi:glycosyltransferase involved in cell wall biosynthesis
MEKRLMPQAIQQADRIAAVSTSTAKAIEAEYIGTSNKIRIVYPGITDLPVVLNYRSLLSSLSVQQPYILFVGTHEPRKNLKQLLKAYSLLKTETRRDVQLVIAGGNGWGNVDLDNWVKNLGLTGHVVITGYVDDVTLSALYANSLFLAMPSLYEGFGLPIVEAMSYGKPVLTSNISSMPEVAGEAGILVNPFDEYAIATGLKLLLNCTVREKLSSKAKANAARFTLQASTEQLWLAFQEAIETRKDAINRQD